MRKPVQQFAVDALAFAALVLLVSTGLLMFFILPPGSHGATVWGMGRHAWGDLHFRVAAVFAGLLVVHLALHWSWIVCMMRGRAGNGAAARRRVGAGIASVAALLALAAAPLLSPPETAVPEAAASETAASEAAASEAGAEHVVGPGRGERRSGPAPAAGFAAGLTLGDVAEVTGVPVDTLVRTLGLPSGEAAADPLGRLRERHGVRIEDVRHVVRAYLSATPGGRHPSSATP